MTMVNSTVTSTPNRGAVSLRKTNKPLMEKRRRARINDSLSQLKSLVIQSSKKDSSQFSKLEKADILELTVKHLRGLQAQQHQQQQIQQHHLHHQQQQHQMSVQSANPSGPADVLMNGKYRAGFAECANEVIRYMDQSQTLNPETKNKVVSHLTSCLQLVSAASHSQNKIPSQQMPPQPVVAQAPPQTNTAAILNGQIIQIVQGVQQSSAGPTVLGLNPQSAPCSTAAIQGINLSTHSEQQLHKPIVNGHNTSPVHQQPPSKPTSAQVTSQPAYIHYAQPLHIQIPPIVSPLLVHKVKDSQQQQQLPQSKQIELRESNNSDNYLSSSSSSSHSSSTSSLPDQVNDIVSSSTTLSSSPPAPRVSTSPPSLYPGHPKARAQKHLNFYTKDEHRPKKYSRVSSKRPMTPSSMSSSSSSESENTSPLNLSQSPLFPVRSDRAYSYPLKDTDSQQSGYRSSLHCDNFAFKEVNHSTIPSNMTSVIVNSRKCADFTEGKYWSMMEEERHCIRHHNTPSPASSMGEERLWRPW